ncbi:hypothetical protein CN360_20295 [Bacillus cereus]|nr:hypothetical protein COM98_05560 [Bacillus cereus]PEW33426.1 hypothetical protein CN441_11780 [Bacillus cereus]PEY91460.1 hypothetical protein CN360_20295 [Bacillus cereus]PGE46203.1 hypothetical protein COM63_18440 [Bacillus cereus]PGR40689.1 hypothetical protein COC64_02040 [Bacillus cereus]
MKKKLLIGSMIILGIGACNALTGGNSIKDTEKSAKVKQIEETSKRLKLEEAAAEKQKAAEKAKEEEAARIAKEKREADRVTPDHFNTCNERGLYCNRGLLNRDTFDRLAIGDTTEAVVKKLSKNANYASKTTMLDVEGIEYNFSNGVAMVKAFFVDGKLYYADHAISDTRNGTVKITTLDNSGNFTEVER